MQDKILPEIFILKRASRVIFVQYLFSQMFFSTDLKTIIDSVLDNDNEYKYDEIFLNKLIKIYNNYNSVINDLFMKYNKRNDNIDQLVLAVLIAGITELFLNEPKIVISEYLKIGDMLHINSSFINGILDKISIELRRIVDQSNN
jgi:transcription termination factor NusB